MFGFGDHENISCSALILRVQSKTLNRRRVRQKAFYMRYFLTLQKSLVLGAVGLMLLTPHSLMAKGGPPAGSGGVANGGGGGAGGGGGGGGGGAPLSPAATLAGAVPWDGALGEVDAMITFQANGNFTLTFDNIFTGATGTISGSWTFVPSAGDGTTTLPQSFLTLSSQGKVVLTAFASFVSPDFMIVDVDSCSIPDTNAPFDTALARGH
jgi:hypothetical protein